MAIQPVILAGGTGTRLWPLSRELYPKQVIRLLGEHSLLQNTLLRAALIPEARVPLLVASEQQRFMILIISQYTTRKNLLFDACFLKIKKGEFFTD